MGARFDVSHINLVGYLTDESGSPAPRVDFRTLHEFLISLAYGERLISATQGSQEDWTRRVASTAEQMVGRLNATSRTSGNPIVESAKFLEPLRMHFTSYDFYALILPGGRWDEDLESFAFFKEAGAQSDVNVLVLLPSRELREGIAEFVDPFPALRQLAAHPVAPPGVMFWTKLGSACSLPLRAAKRFFRGPLSGEAGRSPEAADAAIEQEAIHGNARRILHLSDVHFGSADAERRRGYLKEHVIGLSSEVDRIAITGDLLDTPSQQSRSSFEEFRRDVERHHDKRILVVPGNHDMRTKGNAWGRLGRAAEQAVSLAWNEVEVDHDMRAVFLSFNSSESGDFARGSVDQEQRLRIATEFDQLLRGDPEVADYMKVALVHHHPVKYKSKPTATYQRLLPLLGGEERYIAFQGADVFLRWCAKRDVRLVLHGHKHIPHLAASRPLPDDPMEIRIVGCGSSVGAEHTPMCYDIVTIDPATKRSNVSFYHDEDGDGGGFRLQNVAIDLRPQMV